MDISEVGEWYIILLLVVSEICNSPLTLIASCLSVMAMANGIIRLTNAYLGTWLMFSIHQWNLKISTWQNLIFLNFLKLANLNFDFPGAKVCEYFDRFIFYIS